jgi:hypothetical protein
LKAEYQSISVRCSFCHYESPLVPIYDFETPEQWEQRTGEPYPKEAPVWYRGSYPDEDGWHMEDWQCESLEIAQARVTFYTQEQIVCANSTKVPPKDWRPEEMPEKEDEFL